MTETRAYLRQLSEANGVSGREEVVRSRVLDAIQGHADSIRIDSMGSITAVKAAAPGSALLRVMVAAHMDEVGFMVMGYDGDGLIRFAAVGGIDDRILPGLRVRVGEGALPGVIVWVPIHKNNDQTVVKITSLRIDIGATSKDDAASRTKRGDRIAFDARYLELPGGMLRGKAFDDRVGCSLLIDLLRASASYPVELIAAFTVQEEIGLRGAQVVAQTMAPDVAFVLEGTTANDIPDPMRNSDDERDVNPTCRMGGGPVLTVIDRSLVVNPKLLHFLRRTAETDDIPYQIKSTPGGGTDGGSIHLAGAGVPTAVIALPCRYIHSPMAYLHSADYEAAFRLISAALHHLTRNDFIQTTSHTTSEKTR